jgi:maltose alpha-D-glucosyltransferase / alpha-amylase
VAGMLRSFNYARHAALRVANQGNRGVQLASWERQVRRAFLDAYLERTRAAHGLFLPRTDETLWSALDALELEKALYELQYELGNRPDWVAIPLTFLVERASTAKAARG